MFDVSLSTFKMAESEHKSGLYRWQRQTKPKTYSRSQKVEDASVRATDAAFGVMPSGKERGRAAAQVRSRQVRDQEEAYSEAQELLNQWVNDKIHFDEDDGLDDLEAWRRARNARKEAKNTSKSATDSDDEPFSKWLSGKGLDSSLDFDEAAIYERVKRSAVGDDDPYAGLLEMDEQEAVSSVIHTMMTKEVIKDTFKRDVDDVDRNVPDPRTKMELRHRMVKDNREKRQEEERKRLAEKQMRKEARLSAQQMIIKEQREKDNKTRREEAEIKKEMTRIRKEIAEENSRKEEGLRREREEKELMAKLAKEELERQKKAEEEEILSSHRSENEKRQKLLIRRELWRTKQENKRLKILHSHFSAWYNLVLSQRLLMGKVKAMSDWKVMVKVWGAWKSYVRGQRAQVEAVNHEKQVIESHRKMLTAERHYNNRLLTQCFEGWWMYTQTESERKAMEEEKNKTKAKMMALLHAVAEGTIQTEAESEEDKKSKLNRKENGAGRKKDNKMVNEATALPNSGRPEKPVQAWLDPNDPMQQQQRPSSSLSQNSSSVTGRRSKPIQPWQITKKHVQMNVEEIRNLNQADSEGEETERSHYTDAEIRKRFGTQPWMNRHYVVNNFEHRYVAQQKALKEQQEQIKEQRRMIEELKFQQNNQRLKQQLKMQTPPNPSHGREEIEVPPTGKQIPRDEKELESVDENGMLAQKHVPANTNNNRQHPEQSRTLNEHDDNQVEEQNLTTERSNLTTDRSNETSSTVSVPQGNTKYLKVLKNMEDRAAQRARQKAEREERRRKQEEEKLAQLERLEEERLKQIEDEKKSRVEAFRQKKRLEKQKEEERQKEAARQQELTQKAEEHYNRALLKYRCLLPLKKLVGMSKRNWVRAVKHHNSLILRQTLREWQLFADTRVKQKQVMADNMAEFLLVKHSFQRWKKYKYHSEFLLKRADRHFHVTLKAKLFRAWTEFVTLEREATVKNEQLAHEHYLDYLLRSSFLAWRHLPEQQKREEERKKRKSELRQRVAELIPDFVPCASPAASQNLHDE